MNLYNLTISGKTCQVIYDFARSSINLPGIGTQKIATHGAWTSDNVFQVRTYMYETPFYDDHTFTFDNDELAVELQRKCFLWSEVLQGFRKELNNNN